MSARSRREKAIEQHHRTAGIIRRSPRAYWLTSDYYREDRRLGWILLIIACLILGAACRVLVKRGKRGAEMMILTRG